MIFIDIGAKMKIEQIIKNFERKNYLVKFFQNTDDATAYLCNQNKQKTIGFGDSNTIQSLNLFEKLSIDNIVLDPYKSNSNEEFIEIAMQTLTTQIYITSVNAFSYTGELINIDGTGNRIAGSLFGHKKVCFVIGLNKGEETLEKAIYRAKNIAAPMNSKRLKLKTPCATNDKCYDCNSIDRICNALIIHYYAMNDIESEIIFINENLGY